MNSKTFSVKSTAELNEKFEQLFQSSGFPARKDLFEFLVNSTTLHQTASRPEIKAFAHDLQYIETSLFQIIAILNGMVQKMVLSYETIEKPTVNSIPESSSNIIASQGEYASVRVNPNNTESHQSISEVTSAKPRRGRPTGSKNKNNNKAPQQDEAKQNPDITFSVSEMDLFENSSDIHTEQKED